MAWILLIISLFIHTLSAYAMGDIVVHALQYEVTKGVIFGNVAILLGCILVRLFLDKFLIPYGKKKNGMLLWDLIAYFFGTVLSVLILELNFNFEVSQNLVMSLLLLIVILMAEKDIYIGFVIEAKSEDVDDKTGEKVVLTEGEDPMTENGRDEDEDTDDNEGDDTDAGKDRKKRKRKKDRKELPTDAVTSRDVFCIIFSVIGTAAFITLCILALITIRFEESRYGFYVGMAIATVTAILFRQLGRSLAIEDKEKAVEVDPDSWEYWESQERTELVRRRAVKVNGILFGVLAVLSTVLLCLESVLLGMVFLLGAFLIAVIIPMGFYYRGTGGTQVIHDRVDRFGRSVIRFFQLIVLLLATWKLSYGALWEYQFLLVVATILAAGDYLFRQNR